MRLLIFFFCISFLGPLSAQKIEVVKEGDAEYIVTRDTSKEGDITVIYKPVKSALEDLQTLRTDLEREAEFGISKLAEMQEYIDLRHAKIKDVDTQISILNQKLADPPVVKRSVPEPAAEKPPVVVKKKVKKPKKPKKQ